MLLAAVAELVTPAARRHAAATLILAVTITGLTYVAMLVVPAGGDGYRWFIGILQWPFRIAGALAAGAPLPAIAPVRFAADPTDLITLPALLVPLVARDPPPLMTSGVDRRVHSREAVGAGVMRRRRAVAIMLGVVLLAWRLGPTTSLAAAPDVREITPAGITIDGSAADWDEPAADFLADMFEAGKPDKDVLSRLYGRYDCSIETFYVFVQTVQGWIILPSDNDNYVKLGQTDKLVDGSSRHQRRPTRLRVYRGNRVGGFVPSRPGQLPRRQRAQRPCPGDPERPARRRRPWRTVAWT